MFNVLNEKIKSHLVMLLFSLFVAGSFVFGKIYAELIEPELLTFYRFFRGHHTWVIFVFPKNYRVIFFSNHGAI